MKKTLQIIATILIVSSCVKTQSRNSYLTFSGKIKNKTFDSIVIQKLYALNKKTVIKLSKEGTFKDTLTINDGFHYIFIGDEYPQKVFFQNGDVIEMYADINDFNKTLKFSGKGIEEINSMQKDLDIRRALYEEEDFLNLSEADFKTKINNYSNKFNERLKNKVLDSAFVTGQKEDLKMILHTMNWSFEQNKIIKSNLGKGIPSPKFVDFINYNGGTTSLDDLKGKYVYIDFWATYCKPCIDQFPALDKLIEKYKNIAFVSISLDEKEDFDYWKKTVTDKNLKGIQLFANNDVFKEAYMVISKPRYVLIDPEGKIVDSNTFYPSSSKLIELFNSLNR